ncbi:Uncharacterized conserved protein, DUF362 family [Sporobacter termitidis DSM 10068]|uniref:Uncharacterized conserved protein, DUF362 family n=1 Tax=Sporobacter termitidis DSM 10068 TaxID=1123282 RepID=A0A1M5U477_9FIRM|nr:DUF362 domain-containing protein [Sporobacter termitidis]SHH57748.1 Uncharacterized conserved protein, DUF362 family [Sporobacter termitidis DSM 10068]
MAIVSVLKTGKYDAGDLRVVVSRHFEALGFEKELRPGMKVLIKPNLLGAHRPEQAATTHPAVVRAVVDWLRERGIDDITIADSPGGAYRPGGLRAIYEACGYGVMRDVVKLNLDTGYTAVQSPEGFQNRSFNIIDPIVRADIVVNIAKLKTHGLTTVSAGVKNLFGAIPGLQKPELHYKYPDLMDFCTMLLELAQVVKPQITLIDAVETMEGNGPLNGRIRHMGLTLASRDIFAQDYVAAQLMGLDPESVPLVRLALKKGLTAPQDIETVGDTFAPAAPPYILPESVNKGNNRGFLMRSIGGVIKGVYRAVPSIDTSKCRGCGKCAESCPMQIIKIKDKKAGMSVKTCISCFCCQEMCPFDAVRIRHVLRLPKI